MAEQAVLQIAKAGEDLDSITSEDMALDSTLVLPKVYGVVEMTPDIPEGWVSGTYEYEHGLSYPPMYLYYEKQEYFQNNPASVEFDPERYVYGSQGRFACMDSTEFTNEAAGALDSYLVLFLDPLAEPDTEPEPTEHGSPRLKIGSDLEEEADYKASIDSKYQTLKVHMQDQLVCSLPSWNATASMGADWLRYDWFELSHDLGYPPVHTPFINTVGLSLDLAYDDSIPTDFVVNDVNDSMAERWAYNFGWSGDYMEGLWIYVDINKYYVGYRRQNWSASAHTFPARTVRVNYTIFNLPINEEFNLLS
jgi:hypothetical protein